MVFYSPKKEYYCGHCAYDCGADIRRPKGRVGVVREGGVEMDFEQEKNLAGCCGIHCGLCPRHQSKAASRCPGCKILSQTISCKLYNCCFKKNGFATCAECGDFPCEKYEKFFDFDSFVSHRVCLPNLEQVKQVGLRKWLAEHTKRRRAVENLLANFNEGRSMSFFCVATALMPPEKLKRAVAEARKQIRRGNVDDADIKAKAKIVRSAIEDAASEAGISLKLRHGKK
ncbi:MAG: DUF3795 domain-containing protein [Phycisphaerales bacterium]|nr:MAG: DUF3795 domain-containing protein [Phycisphaerales bacterium]